MLDDIDSVRDHSEKLHQLIQKENVQSRFSQPPLSKAQQSLQSKAFQIEFAVNTLIAIAAPLLSIATQLAEQAEIPDLKTLYQSLCYEIKVYENRAQALNYRSEIILAGRYLICALLDEIILNRPWKNLDVWKKHTLLNTFQRDTMSDERFFIILERSAEEPSIYIEVLELGYICLSLGFRGKYRFPKNIKTFDLLMDNLYMLIQQTRGEISKRLFICDEEKKRKRRWYLYRLHLPPVWLTLIIAGLIVFSIFLPYFHQLDKLSIPAQRAIRNIGKINE